MTETTNYLRDRVLDRDDDLRDVLELLLQRANQRQMWLMFIDDRGCLGDPFMPMSDYPMDPNEVVELDDLGAVTNAYLLMNRAGLILEATGNAGVVLAWERRGPSAVADIDRSWARAMAEAAAEMEIPLRAQFVVHSRGVRQLHADDYV